MKRFHTRVLLPAVAAAVCILILGAITAASLVWRQSDLAETFRENLGSRRAAIELDECLTDLLLMRQARADADVAPLHRRAREHLADIRRYADQPTERLLADQLDTGFDRYLAAKGAGAADLLDSDVLRPCREYKQFNTQRLDENTRRHDADLRTLAWGMGGVGVLAASAGMVLGYAVSRAVRRGIAGIQVRIRDAAGQLAPESADVTVAEEGEFGGLHADIDQLSARIGEVVATLQQREREVRRAEQLAALGQLAAGVAHEVRNPLTGIKLLVQSAREPGGSALTAEDLEVIEDEVRRMEQSLQTFLDFARPPTAERRPEELGAVVRRAFDLLRPRAERQGVTLVTAWDTAVQVVADAAQVRQVILNLGLNALDAMPAGGTLTARVRQTGATAEVELTDTGAGIAADILPRLFQPFASGKDTGLGLGLVIARRIATDHGGDLTGANRPDGGAAFTLTLPV